MNIVTIPTKTLRITAVLTLPLPSTADKYPVKATATDTAIIVAGHCQCAGANVIATNGKTPPADAENNDANAASHGFI